MGQYTCGMVQLKSEIVGWNQCCVRISFLPRFQSLDGAIMAQEVFAAFLVIFVLQCKIAIWLKKCFLEQEVHDQKLIGVYICFISKTASTSMNWKQIKIKVGSSQMKQDLGLFYLQISSTIRYCFCMQYCPWAFGSICITMLLTTYFGHVASLSVVPSYGNYGLWNICLSEWYVHYWRSLLKNKLIFPRHCYTRSVLALRLVNYMPQILFTVPA